jgi:hypothetical protein
MAGSEELIFEGALQYSLPEERLQTLASEISEAFTEGDIDRALGLLDEHLFVLQTFFPPARKQS